MIREATYNDIEKILEIINYYIKHTVINFRLDPYNFEDFKEKIDDERYPFIVYVDNNEVVGFAYASMFREKEAYRYTTEGSIYVDHRFHGKGYGSDLFIELIKELKNSNFKVLISVITLPNDPSIKIHERLGFNKSGILHNVGYKFDKWIDIILYELQL